MNQEEPEKEYLKERARENYVKGLLLDLVDQGTDISQLATNIVQQVELYHDEPQGRLQKIVLGEISDCITREKKNQAAAVADKIVSFLKT